jgi:hypothetical protein
VLHHQVVSELESVCTFRKRRQGEEDKVLELCDDCLHIGNSQGKQSGGQ